MAQTENQKKLLKILNEIFQLDQSDLDFGIYRIMNTKSKEINEFLDKDLISSVSKAFSSNDNSSIQKELDEKVKSFREDGFTEEQIDNNTKIIALREQLSSSSTSSNLENDVFSHLAIFFKRYYKDGDFVSLRRYKKDTYAIPYEGEEVKLHWANSDQYYVKSGEYFRDYTFVVNDKTIHLKLSDAETESNNNKATSDKERRFVILESNPCEVINNELYINFEYKAVGKENQDKLNESAIAKALESIEGLEFLTALNELAPTEKNKTRTIFEKHLKSYTSRNSFDYFIHKDLGGFLGRELDFYIKNEMLFLDDIMDSHIKYEEVMGKVKVFKEVSQKVIAFLTQLEDLQKKLWEKKKFIIETNYCITLDKIDEEHYEQILACDEQKAEWKELFNVDVQSVDDLKEEKYLVLDTKFFDTKFKYKLLSVFDNLDEEIDGVLINSENFGALNLLQDRYKEQIKTVYIDPPYNTGNDGFLYNDTYQHSSWMSFMYDRLEYVKELMTENSVIFSSIDDRELNNLQSIKNTIFGENSFLNLITLENDSRARPYGSVATTHEYITSYSKSSNFIYETLYDTSKEFKNYDNLGGFDLYELRNRNVAFNIDNRPNLYYSFWVNPNNKDKNDLFEISLDAKAGWIEVYPQESQGIKTVWRWGKDKAKENLNTFIFAKKANSDTGYQIVKKYREVSYALNSVWTEKELKTDKATLEIKAMFGYKPFTFPKPKDLIKRLLKIGSNENSIVLDYFAGSGTTGHSVINLNREDNGKRKYILVEMGEYFDTVTKPRIQKVIYSDSWKDGKPTTKNGISQIFKYFKLESYEDTLNNLEFKKTIEQQQTLVHISENLVT